MDLLDVNAHLLSERHDHLLHIIKYRKFVKKIISLVNIPEVLYKFIFNYVGSSTYPMSTRLRSFPKNNSKFHHKIPEENKMLEQ